MYQNMDNLNAALDLLGNLPADEQHLKQKLATVARSLLNKEIQTRGLEKKKYYGNPRNWTFLTYEEQNMVAEKKKLSAVKSVKERTGMSLMQAKNAVEEWASYHDYTWK